MGYQEVKIGVSARHLHLTQESIDILYGKGYQLESVGPARGQFLSTTRATVVGPKGKFERVAVMGPCRDINQFEMAMTDTFSSGIAAPLRMSGDIEGSAPFTVIGTVGEITFDKGAIVAKRHIHMGKPMAERLGLKDGDAVNMMIKSDGRVTVLGDTIIRAMGNFDGFCMSHIDTDEGNAAGVTKGVCGYIIGKTEDLPEVGE